MPSRIEDSVSWPVIVRMAGEGKSLRLIAEEVGCSLSTIVNALQRNGIVKAPAPGGPRSRHTNNPITKLELTPAWAIVIRMVGKGASIREIAKEVNTTPSTIYVALKRNNITKQPAPSGPRRHHTNNP